MADPGQSISTGRETDTVDPSSTACSTKFCHHLAKRHLGSPWSWSWLLVHLLDVCRKHPWKKRWLLDGNRHMAHTLSHSLPHTRHTSVFYLHLKSHDPAARSTLFGCQSRLRTVERIGFLICLLTHLKDKIET